MGRVGLHRQRPATGNKTDGTMGISKLIKLMSSTMHMAMSSTSMLQVRQVNIQVRSVDS